MLRHLPTFAIRRTHLSRSSRRKLRNSQTLRPFVKLRTGQAQPERGLVNLQGHAVRNRLTTGLLESTHHLQHAEPAAGTQIHGETFTLLHRHLQHNRHWQRWRCLAANITTF